MRIVDRFNRHPFWERETRVRGKKLTVPTFDRWLYARLHAAGWMGNDMSSLAEHVRPGMTVVDVGANIGYYTLVLADLVGPSGKVISFEPDPVLFTAASESVRRNGKSGNVELHNCALGSQPGELYLQRGQVNSGDNRLRRRAEDPSRTVPVRVQRLDDVPGTQKADWIKIDVQGWECDVFEGMGRTLARDRDRPEICFEFWPHGIRQAGREPREAVAILRRAGYSLYRREGNTPVTDEDLDRYCRKARRLSFLNLLAQPA